MLEIEFCMFLPDLLLHTVIMSNMLHRFVTLRIIYLSYAPTA